MISAAALPVRHVEHCMGTVFSFDVRAPGVGSQGLAAAISWLHHVDETFSPYRPDSVISRLRRREISVSGLDREVTEVLTRCADLSEATDGFFSAYYDGELDPSGYVKGWAIEGASDILEAGGSTNHCVNGGGDVQCVGDAAPGRGWRVGISDPFHVTEMLRTVVGSGRLAVATSGSAERGDHILDPHQRLAPQALASVTVVGRHLAEVDALATALFAMGAHARDWLASRTDVRAVLVTADGQVHADF